MKKKVYRCPEGTWFCIPIPQGRNGLGVVARSSPKGSIIVSYFFGPVLVCPTLDELEHFKAQDALFAWRVTDLYLENGSWPIIGVCRTFTKAQWPMPKFLRKNELNKTAYLTEYNDADPNDLIGEQRVNYDIAGFELNRLWAPVSVQESLARIWP